MKGKFIPEEIDQPQYVFIFAGSRGSFQETVDAFKRELSHEAFYMIWVRSEKEMAQMETIWSPTIFLTPDYKENEMTDDYRFMRLVSTGHT